MTMKIPLTGLKIMLNQQTYCINFGMKLQNFRLNTQKSLNTLDIYPALKKPTGHYLVSRYTQLIL